MNQYNNSVKICTTPPKGEYTLSLSNTKQAIALTNNRARYYAELAEKYKNEAKEHRDNAQYYAEQNSDVTFGYINIVKDELNTKIDSKQNAGDYALKTDLPTNVSDLYNDSNFAVLNDVINRDTEIINQTNQKFETKVDKDSMVEISCITESYVNGTSWYRIWSEDSTGYKWCEQGGVLTTAGQNVQFTVNLLKPFKDTNYSILTTQRATNGLSDYMNCCAAYPNTTDSFYGKGGHAEQLAYTWRAFGYIA